MCIYQLSKLKLFCHFPGILLPYLWIQISPEMCWWSAQVMSAGQDPKSSCTGVSLFFDFLICVNCVSFCYFFLCFVHLPEVIFDTQKSWNFPYFLQECLLICYLNILNYWYIETSNMFSPTFRLSIYVKLNNIQ